jgi:hypothetical protein
MYSGVRTSGVGISVEPGDRMSLFVGVFDHIFLARSVFLVVDLHAICCDHFLNLVSAACERQIL